MKKSSFSRPLSGALFACLFVVCVSAWAITSNAGFQRSDYEAPPPAQAGSKHASDDEFNTLAFMRAPIDSAMAQQLASADTSAAAFSLSTDAGDFAGFDFANGTRYPEQAIASVGPATYPIMNVAVKTTSDYTDGSGDMIVKDIKIYSN